MRYELTGGFIKNAVLTALSLAVGRDSENPVISQQVCIVATHHSLFFSPPFQL